SRALRSDAQRNRDRLLGVAAEVFAERGTQASLEEIARRADVGIGTLYRHFPSRDHLIAATYRREIDRLCTAAEELCGTLPSDEALSQWMQVAIGYMATKRGMADSLKLLMQKDETFFAETAGRLKPLITGMLERARTEGTIRSDVDFDDFMHVFSAIYSTPDRPDWRQRTSKMATVLIDGMRNTPR
ncbi:TetR/AcrR family transcriptional regulator, partial [Thioclava sp. BHET1]